MKTAMNEKLISEVDLTSDPPDLWRTKLRSTKDGIVHQSQEEHCFSDNVIGVGWGIDDLPSGASIDEVTGAIAKVDLPGWRKRAAQQVRRFAVEAEIGQLIWTRDKNGRYHLGRFTSDWRYDASEIAFETDIHQVRSVVWASETFSEIDIPGAIMRSFIGQTNAMQRILDPAARIFSVELWNDRHGAPPRPKRPDKTTIQILSPGDLEDLIYVWLQYAESYVMVPNARQASTPVYEWTMVHRDTGRRAIVQMKSGNTQVDIEGLLEAATDAAADAIAFAASGNYSIESHPDVKYISLDELTAFARSHQELLPWRVARWFPREGD